MQFVQILCPQLVSTTGSCRSCIQQIPHFSSFNSNAVEYNPGILEGIFPFEPIFLNLRERYIPSEAALVHTNVVAQVFRIVVVPAIYYASGCTWPRDANMAFLGHVHPIMTVMSLIITLLKQ